MRTSLSFLLVMGITVAGCGRKGARELMQDASRLGSADGAEADEAAAALEKEGGRALEALRAPLQGGDAVARERARKVADRILANVFPQAWMHDLSRSWLEHPWVRFGFPRLMEFGQIQAAVVFQPGENGSVTWGPDPGMGEPPATLDAWCGALKGSYTDSADPRLCSASVALAVPAGVPWSRIQPVLASLAAAGVWKILIGVEPGAYPWGLWAATFYLPSDKGLRAVQPTDPPPWAPIAMAGGKPVWHDGERAFPDEAAYRTRLALKPVAFGMQSPDPAPDVPIEVFLRWFEIHAEANGMQPVEDPRKRGPNVVVQHVVFEFKIKKE